MHSRNLLDVFQADPICPVNLINYINKPEMCQNILLLVCTIGHKQEVIKNLGIPYTYQAELVLLNFCFPVFPTNYLTLKIQRATFCFFSMSKRLRQI